MSDAITFDTAYDIVIIGLGEIGGGLLREIAAVDGKDRLFGVDVNNKILAQYQAEGFKVGNQIPRANHYIIAVYSTSQVIEVAKRIPLDLVPLISIESTDEPGTMKELYDTLLRLGDFDLFCFPHRFNPKDPEHQYFNLDRVASAFINRSAVRGIKFYQRYMDVSLIHVFPIEIVEFCKPTENTYRFMEIAFAEELKMRCDEKKIDFEMLRKAVNTKWNINILEARDGVGGKCLPKDTNIISNYFGNFNLVNTAITCDSEYKGLRRKIPKINKLVIVIPMLLFAVLAFYILSNRIFVTFYLNKYIKTFDQFSQEIRQIEEKPKDQRLELMYDSMYKYSKQMEKVKEDIRVKKLFSGLLFKD